MADEILVIVDGENNVTVQNNVGEVQVTAPAPSLVSVLNPATVTPIQVITSGPPGPPGQGVPVGGTGGQALVKIDENDYNTAWASVPTGHVVQEEGVGVAQRSNLNFVGTAVTVTDDPTNNASVVTITGGSGVVDHGALTGLADDDHTQYALADGTRGNFEPTGSASSAVAAHVAAGDPHSQYLIQAEADALYEDAGAVFAHTQAVNAHPEYLTPAEGDLAYADLTHDHAGVYDPAGTATSAVSTHAGEADPHAGYQKESEKNAANGYAGLDATSKVVFGQLPTGTTNTTVSVGDHAHSGVYEPSGTVATHAGTAGHELLSSTTPAALTPDIAGAVGVGTTTARADHVHNVPAAAPTTNLSATTTNTEGSGASFARNDHSHAITTGAPTANITASTTNTTGTSASIARADHGHAVTANVAASPLGSAGAVGTSAALARADHVHIYPTAANVGADPAGTAASAITTHESAINPHPTYLTQTEGDGLYATGTHNHDAAYLSPSEILAGANVTVDTTTTPGSVIINSSATGGSAHIIKDEGIALTARTNLDFVGAGVTVTDNGSDTTIVTIPGGGTADHGGLTGLADNDHPQYQLTTEKGAASGYASLDAGTKVPIAQVPTGTTGTTVSLGNHAHSGVYDPAGTATSAISTHEGAADPHTGYQKESEKAAANGYASLDAGTKVPIAQIPTGTSGTTVSLGDHAHASYALGSTSLTAGSGLTGGGDLSAGRTFNVGAGTGITVNVDDVAVNRTTVDTWYEAAGSIATHAGAADPHTGYQKESEKGAASGYASLDTGTKVPIAQIPTGTTGTTVSLGDHAHTGYAATTTTLTAGAGLTGGGDLSASRTFTVGAGTGITVNADDVAVNRTTVDTWYEPAGTVATHAGAVDPHTGYQLESEKAAANGYASLDASTKVPYAQLPTGTAASTVAIGDHTHSIYLTTSHYSTDNHTQYGLITVAASRPTTPRVGEIWVPAG